MTATKPTVLFVCTHNAGRSALAAALARTHDNRVDARSAGVDPASVPSEVTIASLAEIGIDDSAQIPSPLTLERVAAADIVVAMKPGLDIPQVDGVRYETWQLPDPEGWDVNSIRPLRDEIGSRVQVLITGLTNHLDGLPLSSTICSTRTLDCAKPVLGGLLLP